MSYSKALKKIYELSPIYIQNFFVTAQGFRLKRKKYGRFFEHYFEELSRMQWLPLEELIEIQNRKLREIINWAYSTVPYYREIFDRLNLKPADIKTVSDLHKLPIIDKETVRKNTMAFVSEKYPLRKATVFHTSGTTGKPLTIFVSQNCYQREYAFRWLHYSWGGIYRGDKIATLAGHPVVTINQTKPPFWRYNLSENQLIFSSQHISSSNLPYYIDALIRFQPNMIHGYPSSIYLIAKYIVNNRITDIKPKAIFTASETLLEFQRKVIENAFGCKVYNWYGNTEMVSHATECELGNMHNQLLHSVIEIVNENGEPVRDGEEGVIVGTGLDNYAMPLIRYKVGDTAQFLAYRNCECGRGYPIIGGIIGRVEDYVVTPEGRFVGRLDHVFKENLNVKEAQIIQEDIAHLKIKIVKDENFGDEDMKKIISGLINRLGNRMNFEFEFVNEIPREKNGKFRFVISKVKINL